MLHIGCVRVCVHVFECMHMYVHAHTSGELTYCQPMNLLPGYGVQLVSLLHHPAWDRGRMKERRKTREAGRKDSILRERE